MRFLPYLDDIVPYEPGAPAELVKRGFELDVVVRDRARIRCPSWARVSVGTRTEIDFFLDKLSAVSAGG